MTLWKDYEDKARVLYKTSAGEQSLQKFQKRNNISRDHFFILFREIIKRFNIKKIDNLIFSGCLRIRRFLLRRIKKEKIKFKALIDDSPIVHNGCKEKKRRRKRIKKKQNHYTYN